VQECDNYLLMKPVLPIAVATAWLVSAAWNAPQAARQQQTPAAAASTSVPQDDVAANRATLDRYCVGCHNERTKSGGLVLENTDLAAVSSNAEMWEKVVRRLRAGTMPPQGARRPDEATAHLLRASLERDLDRAAAASPDPGRPMLHRLNRAEYANAIRDLLALDVDVAALLPADDSAYGFDNISDVLGVSPSLQERYLVAARKISALAVGDPGAGPTAETYRARQDLSQNQHIEGLPLGTAGGLLVRRMFPLDAEYAFKVNLQTTNFGNIRGVDYPQQLEITVDGERVHVATIGGDGDLAAMFEKPKEAGDAIEARLATRVRIKAGPHAVGVAFIRNLPLADTRRLEPFLRSSVDTLDWTGLPHVQTLTISGPFNATGAGDTPSRRQIFSCRPAASNAELSCAKQILNSLTRRAYRRPVTDADLQPLIGFFEDGRRDGSFDSGIQAALQAILASPQFVFRVERDPVGVAAGSAYPLDDLELASRLSFFLWSSIPDAELLKTASQGKLKTPAVLEQQVRRMLADAKADAIVSNFAGQWLQLRNVKSVLPNSDEFPDFDDNLRQSLLRETELFFASIMEEDRSVLDLLRADYTFVNERLARHYGIRNVYGSQFRRVTVTDEWRRGLLGQGSILALTSHAERTSPVVRGKWILENVLGTPPPPPPPDVPALKENQDGQKPRSMRELMTEHRANPACAGCHKVMDPIGFAMERFDAVGAARTHESGLPIDTSGDLADGTRIDGVVALRQALLSRPQIFVSTLTEKMLTYALGRGIDYHDMPTGRRIVREAAADDYRFSSIVLGITRSVPFQMRTKPVG
jgi:mono/diheme cytochrome c family protein